MNWIITLTEDEYNRCLAFATKSAKTQREHRSGGVKIRTLKEIQDDTMRGKVAEVVSQRFLEQTPLNVTGIVLDFNIYPRGIWDEGDFTLNGQRTAIKSAKWFSRWLLLETKDILRGDTYDYYIMITVAEDFKSGTLMGYAEREEILNNPNTLQLKQGQAIPGTKTLLDAANYARHSKYLRNSQQDWQQLADRLRE